MSDELKLLLGQRLKQFRKSINQTQKELADHSSISQANIARMESGDVYPSFRLISYLHEYYDMNINWLLTGEGKDIDKMSPNSRDLSEEERLKVAFPHVRIDDTLVEVCRALADPKLSKLLRHKFAITLQLTENEFPHLFSPTMQGDMNKDKTVIAGGGVM